MKSGKDRIESERQRQALELGYGAGNDDAYTKFELSKAAACYYDCARIQLRKLPETKIEDMELEAFRVQREWPWNTLAWKPSADPLRNLEKAGALMLAEAERLRRKGEKELAKSYEDTALHFGTMIDGQTVVDFHEATLEKRTINFHFIQEHLPGERMVEVGMSDCGLFSIGIFRRDEDGRQCRLEFNLTADALDALEKCIRQIRLNVPAMASADEKTTPKETTL